MKLFIQSPGALTTIQDLGRWGYQAIGMPVSGAMDAPALVRGNILLGNPDGAAALEITMMGPSIRFEGEGAIAVTGGDLSPRLNGQPIANWTAVPVRTGDVLSFGGPRKGLRAYLCTSGGIDVPLVMGSRSTYMKAGIGGLEGRKLQKGDVLVTGEPGKYAAGTECPESLRPEYGEAPLRTVPGPQDSYIRPEGVKTFFETEYRLSASSDRMGCRMEGGTPIEHVRGPDIVSDAIPMGAVQVPGQGLPIVMMADRQTTGGYVKIGVVHALDVARLSQFLPGSPVRFSRITQEAGIELSKAEASALEALRAHVAAVLTNPPSRPQSVKPGSTVPVSAAAQGSSVRQCGASSGAMNITVNGEKFFVTWERTE
ncbi:MAG: biotin-dependent carboxyltransferase family protein [Fretibacterium sp.]|nr:biotin-dependent carboxyltransferase family protein [Fretibacterium sp.]